MRQGLWLTAAMALALPVQADFSYEQTSQITGGSMLRMMKMIPGGGKATQPQTSRILLKGNRLATVSQDSISVTDIDAETMTNIDLKEKKYSVITFAEMREAMKAMEKKMQGSKTDQPAMEFSVKVDATGQTKPIDGLATKQFIMTLTTGFKDQQSGQTVNMDMVSDMWLAPKIAGYEQMQQFYVRMAEKMNWVPGMMSANPMMMGQKGASEGMAKMVKEASKLDGIPVFQVMTMQGMGGMPGGSPGEMPPMPNAGDVASDSAKRTASQEAARTASPTGFGGLAGAAAGGLLGGFGRKKKPAEPPPAEQAQTQQAPAAPEKPAPLMEVTVQSKNFSAAPVDAAPFAVPAGFKQVEHDMKKMSK